MTACARSEKSPVTLREELLPRSTEVGSEDRAADAVDRAVGDAERIDAVPEPEHQPSALRGLARAALERLDDAGAGAPGDVKARHRVAVAHRVIAAALGPADHREDAMAHRAQPVALLAGRERDIGLGPLPRPVVLCAIEAGGAHPVLQRELRGVLDAEPALLGRDRPGTGRRTTRRPGRRGSVPLPGPATMTRLPASAISVAATSPARPRANHDHICIVSHVLLPRPAIGFKTASLRAVNAKWTLPVAVTAPSSCGKLLFQFGTFSARHCSVRATPNLNLF